MRLLPAPPFGQTLFQSGRAVHFLLSRVAEQDQRQFCRHQRIGAGVMAFFSLQAKLFGPGVQASDTLIAAQVDVAAQHRRHLGDVQHGA